MPGCLAHLHDLKEFAGFKVWSGSIDIGQRGLAQPRGVEIFAGVFSCKFLVLFYKTRKLILTVKKGCESWHFYYP